MATWQAIVNGVTYDLSNGAPFKMLSITGIGSAPVRRLEERGPFQDGVTDTGYRLDARLINLVLNINGATRAATDGHRDTLGRIFSPAGGATIYLRCTRDDGEVRQIDCYATGMVDMPAELAARPLAAQRVGVQLKAPNPIWYDPAATTDALISNAGNWYLAGGLIGTADVFTHSENVTGGTVWANQGTVEPGMPFSIVVRSACRSTTGDVLFEYERADFPGNNQSWNMSAPGTVMIMPQAPIYFDVGTGTATYFMVSDGMDISIYENSAPIAFVPGWGANGVISAGSARWGKNMVGAQAWDSPIAYAAVYRKALTAQERSVLRYLTDNSDFINSLVTNDGSWSEYPRIVLAGPLADPIVTNQTTGETLDFTGATIPAAMFYIADCRYGFKTVIDSGAVNQIAKLSDDSDLATFHLEPGVNLVGVSGSGTATATAINITHYDRYLGL
jgi:hypothetical protein